MTIHNSVLNTHHYSGYSNISSMGDTVSITNGPAYSNHVYSIDTSSSSGYSLQSATVLSQPEKRHNLRTEGKLPQDIWALLFNNGTLHD